MWRDISWSIQRSIKGISRRLLINITMNSVISMITSTLIAIGKRITKKALKLILLKSLSMKMREWNKKKYLRSSLKSLTMKINLKNRWNQYSKSHNPNIWKASKRSPLRQAIMKIKWMKWMNIMRIYMGQTS